MKYTFFYMTGYFKLTKQGTIETGALLEIAVTKDITIKYYPNKLIIETPDRMNKEQALEIVNKISKHLFRTHSNIVDSLSKAIIKSINT